jgi:hypothetical protein
LFRGAVPLCPAGSDLDFAVNGWVTRTVPAPADDDGFGSPQQQQQVAVEVHEWPALEQQYLLADLADALEAKGLVQGQVGTLMCFVLLVSCCDDGDVFFCQCNCSYVLWHSPPAGVRCREQQYLLADLADALDAKGLVQGQVCNSFNVLLAQGVDVCLWGDQSTAPCGLYRARRLAWFRFGKPVAAAVPDLAIARLGNCAGGQGAGAGPVAQSHTCSSLALLLDVPAIKCVQMCGT